MVTGDGPEECGAVGHGHIHTNTIHPISQIQINNVQQIRRIVWQTNRENKNEQILVSTPSLAHGPYGPYHHQMIFRCTVHGCVTRQSQIQLQIQYKYNFKNKYNTTINTLHGIRDTGGSVGGVSLPPGTQQFYHAAMNKGRVKIKTTKY